MSWFVKVSSRQRADFEMSLEMMFDLGNCYVSDNFLVTNIEKNYEASI